VRLDDALRRLDSGDALPPRAVALTFDDGYRDNLELAVPLLRSLDLPATFFLVPGLLSRQSDPWWEIVSWAVTHATVDSFRWGATELRASASHQRADALEVVTEALKRRDASARQAALDELVERLRPAGSPPRHDDFLDWDGAAALVRAGFGVGSHTSSHVILGEETVERQRAELEGSRSALERELGVAVSLLAYPNGTRADYGPETVTAAAEAGYTHALTTQEGWNDPGTPSYEVRRYVVYPERGLQELASLSPTVQRAGRLVRRARRSALRGRRGGVS
jgi:peptidoglycan/xylan/chitin deacetylase (PgdA/CDA1 family)